MTKIILSSKTFIAKSLGCRTNQAEIETISLQLTDYGLRQIGDGLQTTDYRLQQPDLVLLNTCVVTSKAEKETRKEIRNLRKKYPHAYLVVLGCAITEKQKFNIILPEADLLISNEEKYRTIELIEQLFSPEVELNNQMINKYTLSGRKFIKIQDGCNNFCSFCLTSLLRGRPVSTPLEKIIEEVNYWVEKGIKEIILTGINIGLYGFDSGQARMTITNLVNQILEKTSVEKLTFSSIYPEMLTDDFLTLIVGNSRITQCFHLSLQSGSPTVLARMNRKTKLNELIKKLQWIKAKNSNFTLRADIIVGFPGETEEEFLETLEFIKSARVSFAHVFTYSPRKGTVAYGWKNLPESIKKGRSEKIRTTVEKIREEEGKKMIGQTFQCLVVRKPPRHSESGFAGEESSRRSFAPLRMTQVWEGITENGWPIGITNYELIIKNLKGTILPVKITGFEENYLLGVKD